MAEMLQGMQVLKGAWRITSSSSRLGSIRRFPSLSWATAADTAKITIGVTHVAECSADAAVSSWKVDAWVSMPARVVLKTLHLQWTS